MATAVRTSALECDDWELTNEPDPKPGCLIVQLRRSAHVFPWFRFIYSEGDGNQVVLYFASHIISVTGHGLATLLAAISTQRVVRLIQPTENDAKFRMGGPGVTTITVETIK